MENELYHDPNAFIKRVVEQPKQKVDKMHIEKVMYPVNYDNFSEHHDKSSFEKPKADFPQQQHSSGFDISKILPLLNNFTNMNKPKKVTAKVVDASKDTISKYKRVE